MRLIALGLVTLLPTVALGAPFRQAPQQPAGAGQHAAPTGPVGPAPGRIPMYGAQSHSDEQPRMTAAEGSRLRGLRQAWRTPNRSQVLAPGQARNIAFSAHARNPLRVTGPGTATLKVLDRGELSPEQISTADAMEDQLDDTEAIKVFPTNRAQRFKLLRAPDIRPSAVAVRDTHTQLELHGYTGGEFEVDVMMPSSGHDAHDPRNPGKLIDYRFNARNDRLVLTVEHPNGHMEQVGPFPGTSYGHDGDLQRGAYVTTARLKLPELQVGATKLTMSPEFTSVGGFANGRILEIIRGN